jgi:C1A family cysteine protease
MNSLSLDDVRREIHNKGAKWSTIEQSLAASFRSGEITHKLGLSVTEQELARLRGARQKIDFGSLTSKFARRAEQLTTPISAVDWRSFNGKNVVTSIKDQAGCASCVAFGVAAAVESMAIIEHDNQYICLKLNYISVQDHKRVLVLVQKGGGTH